MKELIRIIKALMYVLLTLLLLTLLSIIIHLLAEFWPLGLGIILGIELIWLFYEFYKGVSK